MVYAAEMTVMYKCAGGNDTKRKCLYGDLFDTETGTRCKMRFWVYIEMNAHIEDEEATSSTPLSRGEITGHNQALPQIRDRRELHHRWRISPKRLIKQLCIHGTQNGVSEEPPTQNNSGSEDGVSEDRVIRRQQLWRHSVTLRVGSDLPLIWEDPEASHRFLELS